VINAVRQEAERSRSRQLQKNFRANEAAANTITPLLALADPRRLRHRIRNLYRGRGSSKMFNHHKTKKTFC
jgi:hypothetical protein